MPQDNKKIKDFKRILIDESKRFFKEKASKYIRHSKIKDADVHIEAIPTFLYAVDNPNYFNKSFKLID